MSVRSCLVAQISALAGFIRNRSGNVGILFALSTIPVFGGAGAAIDYTMANREKAALQGALDAALLSGVVQPKDKQVGTAAAMFDSTYSSRFTQAVQKNFTPRSDDALDGTASTNVPTSMLGIFGYAHIPVVVHGTAIAGKKSEDICILLMNQQKSQALLVNSGAKLNAPSCEVHVHSTSNPAAIFNATLDVKNICVKGSTVIKNGGVKPPVETSCDPVDDPFKNKLAPPANTACGPAKQPVNGGNVTLNPGVYCGGLNFNGSGTVTLNPGLYVLKNGPWILGSSWSIKGTGVTFYFADESSSITFNGNVNTQLSAPTSGTYANILMYEPNDLNYTNWPINGTAGSSFEGLMYLPSRDVTINSVSNMSTNSVTMVFSTLILNQTNWDIKAGALSISKGSGGGSARLIR